MIYPLGVEEYILENNPHGGLLARYLHPGDVNVTKGTVWSLWENDFTPELWMLREGRHESKAVKDYLDFIRVMTDRFHHISFAMSYPNPEARHHAGHDAWSSGWAGFGMVPMATYLYFLASRGVRGGVLECGAFKGGSTCCLSWVCDFLGLKLYCADSFEGVPEDEGYYSKGDFFGSLDEVRANVEKHGKPDAVEFIKGWFSESLQGFNEDLAIIFLDVDLRSSTMDALTHAFPRLLEHGVIFSDGFRDTVDFEGDQIRYTGGEAAGLIDYFKEHGILHRARPAGPGGLALVVPRTPEETVMLYNPRKLDAITLH